MQIRLTAVTVAVAATFPYPLSVLADDEPTAARVVVTATRQQQRAEDVLSSVEVIERGEIERAGHATLTELLAARQGIQVSTDGGPGARSSVFIRGAKSEHTLLLVDGLRVGSATSGAPALEMIPLALIERVEILRGPASALYGSDAIGGVIHVFTRKGAAGVQPTLRAGAGTQDTYSISTGVAAGEGRLRYNVSAGHDRTRGFDAIPGLKTPPDGDRDGFRNDYLSAALSLGLRDDDEVGLTLFHSDGRNWFDSATGFDSRIDKRVDSAGLHVRNRVAERWFSTMRLGYTKDESHSRSVPGPAAEFDTSQRQFAWQHDIDIAGGSLVAAYEFLGQRVDTTGSLATTRRDVNSVLLGWGGQFDRHSVQFNARRDRNSQFGHKTTGIAAYGYQLHPEWRLHGSIGTAFRAPTFNDLFFPLQCFPPFGCFGGNPDLKPEQALNREVGVTWEGARFSASATYFNNRVKDLIVWGNTPDNVGTAKLEGVELAMRTALLGFNLRANYDYLNASDNASGDELARRAKHSAAVVADRASGPWHYGLEWIAQGRRFDRMPNDAASRLAGYSVTNLFIHHALSAAWRLELRANNVFDKKYESVQGFATPRANAFAALRYTPR